MLHHKINLNKLYFIRVCPSVFFFFCGYYMHTELAELVQLIGVNMKNTLLDIFAAIVIGLMLCIGLLTYFDVLVK